MIWTLFVPLFCISAVFAVDIKGTLEWNPLCPNYTTLGQASVILDDGRQSAGVRSDGQFTIPDVQEGTYILSVISHDFTFDKLRVAVAHASQLPHITTYIPGTPLDPPTPQPLPGQATLPPPLSLPYPISLIPRARNTYFVEHQGFNVLAMFQNPMMVMMVVVGVLMLGMPYILKNLDPELQQEFSERHAKLQSIQQSMQSGDIKTGLSTLVAEDARRPSPGAQGSSGGKGRVAGSRSKKR